MFKGSTILSHTIMVLLTVIVITLLSITLYFIYTNSLRTGIQSDLLIITQKIGTEIIDLYSKSEISVPVGESVVVGEKILKFSPLVRQHPYYIELINDSLNKDKFVVGEVRDLNINVSYSLFRIEANVSGRARGGDVIIKYLRIGTQDGTKDLIIIKGK